MQNRLYSVNLKHLDLWGNMIGDMGLKVLSESSYIKGLEMLKLWKNEIGDDSLELMVKSSNFRQLKTLMLNDNMVTPVRSGLFGKSGCIS